MKTRWIAVVLLILGLVIAVPTTDFTPARADDGSPRIAAGDGIQYPNPRWDPIYQPPIYPLFMGGVYWLGGGAFASKVVQVILSTATVWFLYLLVRRMSDRRAALLAAGCFAFYPTVIAFTHYNWSETVFLFLALPSFLLLFDSEGGIARPRGLFAAGVCFGLAALTRVPAPRGSRVPMRE